MSRSQRGIISRILVVGFVLYPCGIGGAPIGFLQENFHEGIASNAGSSYAYELLLSLSRCRSGTRFLDKDGGFTRTRLRLVVTLS